MSDYLETDYLETWQCPECGKASFYWHFKSPEGHSLIADLPSLPDFSGLAEAKNAALVHHYESNPSLERSK